MSENVSELEQQEYYAQLAKKTSESLAYFYCCVRYDVPFARDCVPRDDGRGTQSRANGTSYLTQQ